MRANLDTNGKLIPPRNRERGELRLKQLRHEIKRLKDETDACLGNAKVSWYARAMKNLGLLRSEADQLVVWINTCTCGSGAHPRRCIKHPDAYDQHVAELNALNESDGDGDA